MIHIEFSDPDHRVIYDLLLVVYVY